ncbi:peroxiredoxin-like family protein [Pseudomarimonas salicorniae]|uniref:AhpC/TSA family protein n=1 Tax=Pseudomarimonas salicorniae TaxID=2933270 RepID=A0ABT0GCK4_9GAMM|nr:peroxiredoxin-like family protein [Lysobacter sp. CAU 1642]MCK7592267.1 AhpC/TSA family protein [Lysobacter sp. CAU 1642]
MSSSLKPTSGAPFPDLTWPTVDGGVLDLSRQSGWRMLIVYRGAHCPLCKRYLKQLESLKGDYESAGISVAALSADPQDRATRDAREEGWTFTVGYGLDRAGMSALGLYVSSPRSPEETDRDFAEPGVFVVNPKGQLHIVDLSNAPFARPDLKSLLDGLSFIQSKDYPIRGTA